jgi:hypothetical protein
VGWIEVAQDRDRWRAIMNVGNEHSGSIKRVDILDRLCRSLIRIQCVFYINRTSRIRQRQYVTKLICFNRYDNRGGDLRR